MRWGKYAMKTLSLHILCMYNNLFFLKPMLEEENVEWKSSTEKK